MSVVTVDPTLVRTDAAGPAGAPRTAAPSPSRLQYVPGLDGVRCYAVLIVALYHFHNFAAGWVGVQAFFVLSGYLITSILLESKETHRESYFKRFYWRRTLRIFPLYFAYIGVMTAAYVLFSVPAAFGVLWKYLYTYTSNFTRLGVYDRGGEFFIHFWSLAVEEQFYLIWPLLVLLVSRQSLKRIVIGLLVGVPLIRLGAGEWMFAHGFEADRVARVLGAFTLTQFDAFAAGAAILLFNASEWRHPQRIAIGGLAVWLAAGAAMLITLPAGARGWSIDTLGHHATTINYYHVWGNTLTNLASAAVILAALKGALPWVFQNRAALHVGKVSYGVYVLHLPMHNLLNQAIDYRHSSVAGLGIFVLYFAAVVLAATVSYSLFESRFLRLKDRVR
jgi:peptidoglycan/LPS O-acetylase OafA/YrhL